MQTRRPGCLLLATALLAHPSPMHSWPSLYTDCGVFPELGQPQYRFAKHPPLQLFCVRTQLRRCLVPKPFDLNNSPILLP